MIACLVPLQLRFRVARVPTRPSAHLWDASCAQAAPKAQVSYYPETQVVPALVPQQVRGGDEKLTVAGRVPGAGSGSATTAAAAVDGGGGGVPWGAAPRDTSSREDLRPVSADRSGGGGERAHSASRLVGCSEGKAEHWVHRFNASGFTTLERHPNHVGRPLIIDGEQVRALIGVALSRPQDLGLAFTQWSVSKLRAYCLENGLIPPISSEWVRCLLRREGVSYQHTKTWKQSPDPDFEVKKNRVLDLYERCPSGGAVVCFDECGPLELRPLAGAPEHPSRPPPALPRQLPPSPGDRATPRFLRCPCRLSRRPGAQAQDRRRPPRRLRPAARRLPAEHAASTW